MIIDTYEDFATYWSVANSKTLKQQITLWQTRYMAKYPELLEKQTRSYQREGYDWRDIAREYVFPKMKETIPLMQEARENLLVLCEPVTERANKRLGLDSEIVFVIYVGIGCGAGWATLYEGQPACLLGLENIVECRWHTRDRLEGLLLHEIGHLAHMIWRGEWETFESAERDPLFQLYSEGFAQRCEHVIVGRETWHQAQDNSWISWCESNKGWLAQEFLKRTEKHLPTPDFFGSWFDIKGKKETGYFLGHAFIQDLEKKHNLRQIALFEISTVKKLAVQYLKSTSNQLRHRSDTS